MIAETSKQAYSNNQEEFDIQRLKILKSINLNQPINNMGIHMKTKISINAVCGRMDDLKNKDKFVTFVEKKPCPYTQTRTQFFKLTRLGVEYLNNTGGKK